jgi:uncharacterized protein (DUF2336 family)
MTLATPLIPGLDEIVKRGDPKRRSEVAWRIAELFLSGAANFRSDHIELFDSVLMGLVPHAELAARADLAERLSILANAPRGLVGQLARDDEISIAGPVLRRSPVIGEDALIEIARLKGQGHLLAMSERPVLSVDLTDVIVRRGDHDVVRCAAGNVGALFSDVGYSVLIRRASQDSGLALAVGQREDISGEQLKHLLEGSIGIVRRRLMEAVNPARQADIKRALSEISGVPERFPGARDFTQAQRTILALQNAGELTEAALLGLAKAYKYEESVVALAVISGVKIATLDRLIEGDRYDPILMVGKVIGLEWATIRALILLRLGPNRIASAVDIESARVNFARLMPSTAERVVGFWKARQSA